MAGGEFNKLYKISTDSGTFLMRVALPVEPYYKKATEVATIHSMRRRTDIPVPKIVACNTSNENILELQWILTDFVSGRQSRTAWRKLPMHKKEGLVKQLAMHQAQLFDRKFDSIGNLYFEQNSLPLKRIVVLDFF